MHSDRGVSRPWLHDTATTATQLRYLTLRIRDTVVSQSTKDEAEKNVIDCSSKRLKFATNKASIMMVPVGDRKHLQSVLDRSTQGSSNHAYQQHFYFKSILYTVNYIYTLNTVNATGDKFRWGRVWQTGCGLQHVRGRRRSYLNYQCSAMLQ